MKARTLLLSVVLANCSLAQPPIDDLPPDMQELLQNPWQRALWDLGGVLNVISEDTIPPTIDMEWAAKEPDFYPQSWDDCADILDKHRDTLDAMTEHAAELRSAADLKDAIPYRRIAQVVKIDALYAAAQDDPERGARRIATIFDVGRAMMTDGSTVSGLTGFALLTLATTALEAELARPEPWLTEQHLGPVRDALTRLAERRMRWPLRPKLDERRTELAARLGALFERLDVEPGLALEPDPALAPAWRGTWVGRLRNPMLDADDWFGNDPSLFTEIRLTFLPVEKDPTRAVLTIRQELIIGDDLGASLMAMSREHDPDEEATRFNLRVVDSAARGWVVETDHIRAEIRERFEGAELEEVEAVLDRYVMSAGQPTDDRFEISVFDPEFDVVHSYRMRLTGDGTMEYKTIAITPEPWSGSTVIQHAARLERAD